MINWYSVIVETQRRQDEVARAAAHNYQKHIMGQPGQTWKNKGHIMAQLLIQAGTWLVNVGCRLQTPYTTLALATRKGLQQDHIMGPQKAPCAS
jgi:hypothetical protein